MNKFNRVMPRKGSVETIIDRLYEYINPVDPKWIKNIKPASCEDIKKLESICGLKDVGIKVPKSYLEYLKCMGESDGELLSQMVGGNKNIKIILNLYDDIISYDKD
ncbi:MAG: hypothetical protein N4A54_03540, partial [Peptostreptococcaceae bacterium]|nr:hypothetical protein [Peptostreptococcaceae bacterium]